MEEATIKESTAKILGKLEHHPLTTPVSRCLRRSMIQLNPINRICFRGDSREPNIIFEEGFQAFPVTQDEINCIKNLFESNGMVSTSKRFKSALLFPIPDKLEASEEKSYIYVVHVNKGFDVHMHGLVNLFTNPDIPREEIMAAYVEEIITDAIEPKDIVAAVQVIRQIQEKDQDYYRGSYELKNDILINPDCMLPQTRIEQINHFLQEEIRLNAQAICTQTNLVDTQIAEPQDGFTIMSCL